MTPEGVVKKEVKAILKARRVYYFMPVSNGYGSHGTPDFVCSVAGRFLGIECKAKDGMQPTELQAACHENIWRSGGTIFIATPGTLDALPAVIELLKSKS